MEAYVEADELVRGVFDIRPLIPSVWTSTLFGIPSHLKAWVGSCFTAAIVSP